MPWVYWRNCHLVWQSVRRQQSTGLTGGAAERLLEAGAEMGMAAEAEAQGHGGQISVPLVLDQAERVTQLEAP